MSGKQKQAHRTKGNVRPSSSARAAEQLASSGAAVPGFIGFGALSDLGYVPASGTSEEVDASVDSDFRMVLRKLSKRDSTTKIKALQELSTLCQEKDLDSVKTVLPFWPRIFTKLATDNDRRVRETCHQTFEQMVLRVRKNLAPHLKTLMGPWIVGQCDVYPPAASAAKASFQAAFPPAKQAEAVAFCKEEVIGHISDNLLVLTPTTLSDPKTTEKEDMEARYQKLVASSLQGWKLFTSLLATEHQDKLHQQFTDILSNAKFWKLGKHQATLIRGSFYLLMGALCQSNPALANQYADKICPLILYNLDESDPAVCPALWEAVLYTISTIEDCWSKVNARKGVFPKLWGMMKQGGNGCAYLIHPNLLPLLIKIPADVTGDDVGFYKEWFGNMTNGLSEEKVQTSKIEISAIINAHVECIRYVITQHTSDGNTDCQIVDYLLHEQLLLLLETSFVDEAKYLSASPLYSLVADLLLFLYKHESAALQGSSGRFWKTLGECMRTHIEQTDDSNSYTLTRIGAFLKAFVKPVAAAEKKKSKIKFADKESVNRQPKDEILTVEVTTSNPLVEVNSPLQLIINRTSSTCLQKAQDMERPSTSHMKLLSTICNNFTNPTLVKHLHSAHSGKSESEVADETMVNRDFLPDVLLPWIKRTNEYQPNIRRAFTEGIVDIIFVVYKHGSTAEKTDILTLLCKNDSVQVLVTMCEKVVEFETDIVVHKWLRGAQFGEAIVSNTQELCTLCLGDTDTQGELLEQRWNLLRLALTTQLNSEAIVGKKYFSTILGTIHNALPQQDKRTQMSQIELDRCVTFVSDVAILLYREMKESLMESSAEDLLLSLYQLSCQQVSPVSETVLAKVQEAWKLGVTSLIQLKGGLMSEHGFFVKAAEHIKSLVKSDVHTCARVEQLSKLSLELAHHIGLVLHEEDTAVLSHPTVLHFMQLMYMSGTTDNLPEWEAFSMVCGQLTFNHQPKLNNINRNTEIPQCVAPTAFTSNLLVAAVKDYIRIPENDFTMIIDVAYAVALCNSLVGNQKQLLSQTELVKACNKLENNLRMLIQKIPIEDRSAFVQSIVNKSLSEGRLWSLCLQVVLNEIMHDKWNLIIESLFNIVDRLNGLVEPVLHTLQVTAPYLGKTELGAILELLTAQLLSCDQQAITDMTGGRGFLAGACVAAAQQENPIPDSGGGGIHLEPQVIISVLPEVQLWREQHEDLFLFESDLGSTKCELVSLNVEVMKLLKLLVEKLPAILSEHQWDFLLCSLVSWAQSCHESRKNLDKNPVHQSFLFHTCELLSTTAMCMKHVLPERREAFPPNLSTEWTEFFSQGAYSLLLPIYVQCTEALDSRATLSAYHDAMLRTLCTAVSECPLEHLKSHQLPAKLVADHYTSAPDDLQTVLNHLCPRLISTNRATQITAYRLLQRLVPELPAFDSEKAKNTETDEETRSPPPALMSVLDTCRAAVDLIMSDILVGEPIVIEADTEEDMYTRGYLLCWDLLLTFFKAAPSEMRAQYASCLRNLDAVDHLLANLFRLMPENPVIQLKDSLTSHSPSQKLSSMMSMFSRDPVLLVAGDNSSLELEHLACAVYHRALQDLPAIARQWWSAQDKRVAAIVDKFTSKHVTHVLCSEEMEAIHQSEVAMEDMTVKTRPTAREVAATYTIQVFTMELVITLPVNHPLGVVSVESGKRVGVPTNLWRNWMLQMTTFLTHQNGTMLDGLALWKRNVDKKFAGVEECMVCFSVIHPSNYQLPKLQCKVCKKKFHSACLYKWFSTSNNSTCPMCRGLF